MDTEETDERTHVASLVGRLIQPHQRVGHFSSPVQTPAKVQPRREPHPFLCGAHRLHEITASSPPLS